jgi:deazaflavin-dependent oxidoreductase (nitroreductase family)
MSSLHTFLYRATAGLVGRRLVNNNMLLLTTIGETSGSDHTVPLLYLRDQTNVIVIASYGGRPDHPQWYRNLLANPHATVQILGEHLMVTAVTLEPDDRQKWWPLVVSAYDDYASYQSKTEREIPIVRLTPS